MILDILSKGVPDIGAPPGQLSWKTHDVVVLKDQKIDPVDELELQVGAFDRECLDRLTPHGEIDLRGSAQAFHKAKPIVTVALGCAWTTRCDSGQRYTIRRRPLDRTRPTAISPLFAPILGGTEAGSKVTATKALVEELGLQIVSGVGQVMRALPVTLQLLSASPLQLDRLFMRLCSMYLGLQLRSGSAGRGYVLQRVNPPNTRVLSTATELLNHAVDVSNGAIGYFVHPHRSDADNFVLQCVMGGALATGILWPGAPLMSDQLWPSLGSGPSHLLIYGGMTATTGAERVAPADVLTAVECLCADFGIEIDAWHRMLDTALMLCYHPVQQPCLGMTKSIEIALPDSRLDALAILPMLRKGDASRPALSHLRTDIQTLYARAIARADVVRRAWHGAVDLLRDLPGAINPLAIATFDPMLRTQNGASWLWQHVQALCEWLGHEGPIGGIACSAVSLDPDPIRLGTYYGFAHNIRFLHSGSSMGVLIKPPPPLPSLHDVLPDLYVDHGELERLLILLGMPTVPSVTVQRFSTTPMGVVSVSVATHTQHGCIVAQSGNVRVQTTVRCDDEMYRLRTGPLMELRSPDVTWHWSWNLISTIQALTLQGNLSPPAPPGSAVLDAPPDGGPPLDPTPSGPAPQPSTLPPAPPPPPIAPTAESAVPIDAPQRRAAGYMQEATDAEYAQLVPSSAARARADVPLTADEDVSPSELMVELLDVPEDELSEPQWSDDGSAYMWAGAAGASTLAARGICDAVRNVSLDWAMDAVRTLGARDAMTLAIATNTGGARSEQMSVLAHEYEILTGPLPFGLVTAVRRDLRDYVSGNRQPLASSWSGEELDHVRDQAARIHRLRRRPVAPGGEKFTMCAAKKGPYADYSDILRSSEAVPSTAAYAWQWSNGVATSSARRATLSLKSEVARPAPPPPANAYEETIEGVTYTNTPGLGADSVAMRTINAAYLGAQLLSRHEQPGVVWVVRSGTDHMVNTRNVGRYDDSAACLAGIACDEIWLPDTSATLIEPLHAGLIVSGNCRRVFVPGLAANADILRRLKAKADVTARKLAEQQQARVHPGAPPIEQTTAAQSASGTAITGPVKTTAWLESWLRLAGDCGDLEGRWMCTLADHAFELCDHAATRAQFVALADIAVGFATIVDANQMWRPGDNADMDAVLASNAYTANLDIPRLNLDDAVACATTQAEIALADSPRVQLGAWRRTWMAQRGRIAKMRLANMWRAMLDDESAAVDLAARYICATGAVTPMQWVRQRIGTANRGCGGGYCWCHEPVPEATDRSVSTGSGPPTATAWACQRNASTTSREWLRDFVWRGYRPGVLLDELALLPGAARVETFRAALVDMDLTPSNSDDYEQPQENMQLGGVPINCTRPMASAAVGDHVPKRWRPTCNAPPQAHCGFMLWVSALSPHLREQLERWDLHNLPLRAWEKWNKECGPLIRRAGMVGKLKGHEWLQLRKVSSVCVRRATVADYAAERVDRTTRPVVKTALIGDFETLWRRRVREITDWQVLQIIKRADCRSLAEEWSARTVAAPTGSSSCAALLRATARDSVHAEPSDRPNKKAALSAVASGWLQAGLSRTAINIARASTKPEPGNKARTLYSSGDWTTFLASYALRGFEGSANYGGMAASQRPEVIGRWLVGTYNAEMGVQVSADLDNQNWQHELWELAAMWESRADSFRALRDAVCLDKSQACATIARAFERTVVWDTTGLWRCYVGLFSGHRGTTQDNTMDHEADRTVANDQALALGMSGAHRDATLSGDDEWLWQATWEEAVEYLGVSKMMGVRMNARKQQVGAKHGEYLQRCVSGDSPPRQSLAAILATLTTGNWYQPMGTWLNAILDAQCANWLEACTRGLNRTVAVRMCCMVLDQTFVARTEGRARLEWRRYIRHYASGSMLFEGLPGFGSDVPPDSVVRMRTEPQWTTHGFSDYKTTQQYKWIARSLKKEWLVRQFDDSIQLDAMGSTRTRYERDRIAEELIARWPRWREWVEVQAELPQLGPAPGKAETALAWVTAESAGRAVTEEDNLAAMGVGGREVQLLGGYDNLLTAAEPERLCRVRPTRPGPELTHRLTIDTGILSGLRMHSVDLPRFGLQLAPPRRRRITVVAATHGSGISRIARRFNQSVAVRFDRLARGLVGDDAYHRPSDHHAVDLDVYCRAERVVAGYLASGYRPTITVLLTHARPDELVHALHSQGIDAHWVLYTPDEATRARRIAERNLSAGLLRYMVALWTDLYATDGAHRRFDDEERLIQYITQPA